MDHIEYNILWLNLFTQHKSLEIHADYHMDHSLFLFMTEYYSIVLLYPSLFNPSPSEGYQGCPVWELLPIAVVNILI